MKNLVLQDVLSNPDLTRQQCILIILAYDFQKTKTVAHIRDLALANGLSNIKKWNISDILAKSKGLVVGAGGQWELTTKGRNEYSQYITALNKSGISKAIHHDFQKVLSTIKKEEVKKFIEEAISCFTHSNFRAAIVLSWVGAIAILHDHVVTYKLKEYNLAGASRFPKWKNAKTTDDIGQLQEQDFLLLLQDISIIGKNLKQELEVCLKRRNGCGHPNSFVVTEAMTAGHIESLTANVFSKF